MRFILAIVTACVLLLVTSGCAKINLKLPGFGKKAEPQVEAVTDPTEAPAWVAYPRNAEFGEDYDVVAIQSRKELNLVNRCPRAFENVQVWLNQQYFAELARIKIGADNSIPLTRFVNEHGESFPVAGLLTPDKGFPVLSCVLFDPASGKRHRLLARQQ